MVLLWESLQHCVRDPANRSLLKRLKTGGFEPLVKVEYAPIATMQCDTANLWIPALAMNLPSDMQDYWLTARIM